MKPKITVHFITSDASRISMAGTVGHSLMEAAVSAGVEGIAADCGGLLTCATCHVMVHQPFHALLPPPDDDELAMLAFTAVPRQHNSRLSCQIRLGTELDGLTVDLPASQY